MLYATAAQARAGIDGNASANAVVAVPINRDDNIRVARQNNGIDANNAFCGNLTFFKKIDREVLCRPL